MTILDGEMTDLIQSTSAMLSSLKDRGKNKVLWWNNRSVLLCTANQYDG